MGEKTSGPDDPLERFRRSVKGAGHRETAYWEDLLAGMRSCRLELEERLGEGIGREDWCRAVHLRLESLTPEAGSRVMELREELLQLEGMLVEGHMRLVLHVAGRYFRGGIGSLEDMDILQEGCRGLLTAARRHDLEGYEGFSTYAVFVIRRFIIEAVGRQAKLVRVPRTVLRKGMRARALTDGFTVEHGRPPSPGEVREHGETREDWSLAMFLLDLQHLSLDGAPGEGFAASLEPVGPLAAQPHRQVAERMEMERLRAALAALPERSRRVLELRMGFPDGIRRTLKTVAGILGVSPERVRQIEHEAIQKLRDHLLVRVP